MKRGYDLVYLLKVSLITSRVRVAF